MYASGQIDEIRIHNHALSDQEIVVLMSAATETKTLLTLAQQELLDFILGKRYHCGKGMKTCPDIDQPKHNDCLVLEQLGFVYRYYQDTRVTVWMPQEVL